MWEDCGSGGVVSGSKSVVVMCRRRRNVCIICVWDFVSMG